VDAFALCRGNGRSGSHLQGAESVSGRHTGLHRLFRKPEQFRLVIFVWSLGTDYFVEHGGQITVQAPDQNVTQYSAIANGSLQSLTMQYYLNERRGLGISPGGEWKYSSNWFSSGGEYKFLFNGSAGTITVECVDEGDALCRGKVNAVGAAISALSSTAKQIPDPDTPASSIDPLALYNAANQVNASILSGLQSYAAQGQLKDKLQDLQDISEQYGWFIVGSSYWSISWINQEVREAMYSGITYSPMGYSSSARPGPLPPLVALWTCPIMNVPGHLIGTGFEMFIAGTSQSKIIGITGTFSMLVIRGVEVIMTAESVYSNIDNAVCRSEKNSSVVVTACQIRNARSTILSFRETTLVRRVNLPK
jgi:hypothetical protein